MRFCIGDTVIHTDPTGRSQVGTIKKMVVDSQGLYLFRVETEYGNLYLQTNEMKKVYNYGE